MVGWSGIGKSHIIQALGQRACLHGYRVLYRTSSQLLTDLTASLADKTLPTRLRYYANPDWLLSINVKFSVMWSCRAASPVNKTADAFQLHIYKR
jgi:chromosomal replication initiation ATPase DnaA